MNDPYIGKCYRKNCVFLLEPQRSENRLLGARVPSEECQRRELRWVSSTLRGRLREASPHNFISTTWALGAHRGLPSHSRASWSGAQRETWNITHRDMTVFALP